MIIHDVITTNYRRIRTAHVHAEGSTIVKISGANEAGKSSFLDSMAAALDWKNFHCEQPVRAGEESAETVLDVGGAYTVTHVWLADGRRRLKLSRNDDGAIYSDPVTRLREMVGPISFDPGVFAREKQEVQDAMVARLLGLDFTGIDGRRKDLYDRRTEIGREVKRLDGLLASTPEVEAPDVEVSVAALLEERTRLEGICDENEAVRDAVRDANSLVTCATSDVVEAQVSLAKAQEALNIAKVRLAQREKERDAMDGKAEAALVDPDLSEVTAQIIGADAANAKVRAKKARLGIVSDLEAQRCAASALTTQIEALDEEKRAVITGTTFPIPDLSLNLEGRLIYKGTAFSGASSSARIRTGMALAIAMKPKIKVIFIRDASLFDAENLTVVEDMASEHGFQVWLEFAGTRDDGSIVIEDGAVVGAPAEAEA